MLWRFFRVTMISRAVPLSTASASAGHSGKPSPVAGGRGSSSVSRASADTIFWPTWSCTTQ